MSSQHGTEDRSCQAAAIGEYHAMLGLMGLVVFAATAQELRELKTGGPFVLDLRDTRARTSSRFVVGR